MMFFIKYVIFLFNKFARLTVFVNNKLYFFSLIFMDIPVKKLKCGFTLPIFGFGTWQMGGRDTRNPENDDIADINAIKNAIELGITHFDTAEFYAEGFAEKLLSKAIKGYDRSGLIITTKVSPMNFHYNDLIKSLNQSLERIGTDYIDIYLMHAPNPYIPIAESMEAMDYLINKKLIKHIGLSNFDTSQFSEAQKCTNNKIVCNHVHYNLKYRLPQQDGSIKYAQSNDIMVVAWRPVQKGLFAAERNDLLDSMCLKYNKTPSQIAINWIISQDNLTVITKCRSLEHLKENMGALGWQMEKKDIDLLTYSFPDLKFSSDTKTLTDKIKPE